MNRNAHEGLEDPSPSYLSQQHHVLHGKGNVEQRRKTVEEVKLRGEEWRGVKGKSCFCTAMMTSAGQNSPPTLSGSSDSDRRTPACDFLNKQNKKNTFSSSSLRRNTCRGPALTPLSQELCSISVDEVHDLYDHGVNNTGDKQEYSGPECGLLFVDWERPTLHLEVDHHDVERQVEAQQDKGQGHQVDAQLPLSVGVEGLLAASHRVQTQETVETGTGLFEGLLPAQCAPAIS